jgi:hypothetical protein
MTGRKHVITGYMLGIGTLGAGLIFVYISAAGIPLLGRELGFTGALIGVFFCGAALSATSFFSGYAKLGQDIEFAELPKRTFVISRRFDLHSLVHVTESFVGGRTYAVRMSAQKIATLPQTFHHLGGGKISTHEKDFTDN